MPRIALRSLAAAATVTVIAAVAGAEAFGGLPLGGTAPALHSTAGLSVSVPSVSAPSVPSVSTPSVPSVSTPSLPSVSAPSVPSVPSVGGVVRDLSGTAGGVAGRVPAFVPRASAGGLAGSLAGGSSGSSAAAGASGAAAGGSGPVGAAGSSGSSGSSNGGGGGSGNAGLHGASAEYSTVAAEYRGRSGERRLRADIKRNASCLGALPSVEHRMLALRAGIGSAPLSRHDAAVRLHLSGRRAVEVEQRGIADLKSAAKVGGCSAISGPATLASRGGLIAARLGALPQLQPTMLLSGRPSLTTTVALAGAPDPGLGAVEAASASGGSSALASGPAQLAGAQPSTSNPGYLAALLLAAMLVGGAAILHSRREAAQRRAYVMAEVNGGSHSEAGINPFESSVAVLEPTGVAEPDGEPRPAATEADVEEPDVVEGSAEPIDERDAAAAETWTAPGKALRDAGEADEPSRATPATGATARRAAVVTASLASLALTGLLRRRRR